MGQNSTKLIDCIPDDQPMPQFNVILNDNSLYFKWQIVYIEEYFDEKKYKDNIELSENILSLLADQNRLIIVTEDDNKNYDIINSD
jgi:hypothetical protein